MTTLPDLLRLLAIPAFAWIALLDYRTRRVPSRVWYPLAALGVATYAAESRSVADFRRHAGALGRLLGRAAAADSLVEWVERGLESARGLSEKDGPDIRPRVLFVLTMAEVGYAFLSLPKFWLALGLIVMAIWKALLVALYYMHLRFEPRRLWILAASPLPLAAILVVAVLTEF